MTAGTLADSADFREAAEAAQAAYKDGSFDVCLSGCAKVRSCLNILLDHSKHAGAERFRSAGPRSSRG